MTTLKKIVLEEADFNYDDSHYNTLDELDLRDIATAIDGSRSFTDESRKKDKSSNKYFFQSKPNKERRFWFW